MKPGEIYNKSRCAQITSFSGLQFERGISPTDIDGLVEFNDKLFVIIELKISTAAIPHGQRQALSRTCDRIWKSGGVRATVLIARHDVPQSEEIDAAECLVSEFRWEGRWRVPAAEITVRDAIEKLIRMTAAG